jgi:predicted transcriptional regulator
MAEPDPPRWPRLQFRCPPTLLHRLDTTATRLDQPRQQLIRDAIAAHLDRLEKK